MRLRGGHENIWRQLKNEALERMLGEYICDEKDNWNQRSDFEKFSIFCQKRQEILGSEAEEKARLKWDALFGDSLDYPPLFADSRICSLLWKRANEQLGATASEEARWSGEETILCDENRYYEKEECFLNIYDEKYQKKSVYLDFCSASDLLKTKGFNRTMDLILSILEEYSAALIDPSGLDFVRPNPYYADRALKQMICGEKLKNEEKSVLFCQILISISEKINREKLQFDIICISPASSLFTRQFFDYLFLRDLCEGWMFSVHSMADIEFLAKKKASLFLMSEEKKVIKELIKQYPIGRLIQSQKKVQGVLNLTNQNYGSTLIQVWQEYAKESFGKS